MATNAVNPDWAELTPEQRGAWIGFLRSHAAIVRELDSELERHHGLPLSSYDVLVQLAHAGGAMRMSELAEAVVLSRSGITRLVERLERQGLVERCRVETDSRGVTAKITDGGRETIGTCGPTHIRGVRQRFLERLDEDELRALAGAWEKLLA
jgi:DNA-binding MarR family transcriptional regulator